MSESDAVTLNILGSGNDFCLDLYFDHVKISAMKQVKIMLIWQMS